MLVQSGYSVDNLPAIVDIEQARKIISTNASDEQLQAGIDAASAVIRNYCGWHVSPNLECTFECESDGFPELQLPATFVTAVHSVTVNGEPIEFEWKPSGRIRRTDKKMFSESWGSVVVKYSAGIETEQIAQPVAKLAAAACSAPAGIRSESIGQASVTYSTTSLEEAFSDNMRAVLNAYRVNARP